MQMSIDTSDGYVNTLTVADFNLFRVQSKEIPSGLNL